MQRGTAYFGMSGSAEFMTAAILFALMIVLKLINVTTYRFDSDEPQHMHVIWAWARGFVQYRDVFDNHMPLFQIMFAPIFGVIGDRPTILYWMRFILLPMYFVAAWCTYRIGELLFSRRAGIWAVVLAGLFTKYHFISLEFRTDNLWAPLWLLCVVTLMSGSLTVPRGAESRDFARPLFRHLDEVGSVVTNAPAECTDCVVLGGKKTSWANHGLIWLVVRRPFLRRRPWFPA